MARRSSPAALMEAMVKAAKKDNVVALTVEEYCRREYCMPLPHLCLQYVFNATGVRFGGIYMVQGPPGCCKSPFVFFLLSLMCKTQEDGGFGGISYLSELESKISMTLLQSFMDKEYLQSGDGSPFRLLPETTINNCLANHSARMKLYRKTYEDMSVPMAWGIDSIGGAATEEGVKKMEEDGVQGRGFSEKALILTNMFANYSATYSGIPLITYTVNHEKKPVATGGPPAAAAFARGQATGGEAQKFKASLNLKLAAMEVPNGKMVTIQTYKNSFGIPKKIQVLFSWQEPTADDPRQYHKWGWAKATADLLVNPPKGVPTLDMRKVCNVTPMTDGKRYNCVQLGLQGATAEELEKALFANKTILRQVQNLLGIQEVQTFDEYLDMLDAEAAAVKAAGKTGSKHQSTSPKQPATTPATKDKTAQKQQKMSKAAKDLAGAKATKEEQAEVDAQMSELKVTTQIELPSMPGLLGEEE